MKTKNEIKGLQNILQCSEELETIKKRSLVTGIFFFLVGVGIITHLIFFVIKDVEKVSHYFLFIVSGILIAMSYVKYTEKIGIDFISNYFDYDKVKSRLTELGIKPEEQLSKTASPYKTIIHFFVWILIGISIAFIKNNL